MLLSARFLSLLAITALTAILSNPSPALALADARSFHLGRAPYPHNAILKKSNRRNSQKCTQRPSSSTRAPPAASSVSPPPAPKPSPAPGNNGDKGNPGDSGNSGNSGGSSGSNGFWQSNSKLGLAWADGGADYLKNLKGIRSLYTWGTDCPDAASSLGMTCLPQIWGWRDLSSFEQVAKSTNAPIYLTINEPNEPGQANMDFWSGISLWKQAVKPVRDAGHQVCSPATSSNPNGLDWVKNFKNNCPGDCDWDVTCLHFYDTTFEKFKDYVNLWHSTFGKPVLVTEFAPQNNNGGEQPSRDDAFSFYSQSTDWLNSQDFVLGYYPFGFMAPPTGINPNANLLNTDGSLTDLGWMVFNKGT